MMALYIIFSLAQVFGIFAVGFIAGVYALAAYKKSTRKHRTRKNKAQ